jgi:hypothetical protein
MIIFLHLFTFQTPALPVVFSDKGVNLLAFEQQKSQGAELSFEMQKGLTFILWQLQYT